MGGFRRFSWQWAGEGAGVPKVSSVVAPYATYLRVSEPLAAFPEPERGHWTRYARRPDRSSYQANTTPP